MFEKEAEEIEKEAIKWVKDVLYRRPPFVFSRDDY